MKNILIYTLVILLMFPQLLLGHIDVVVYKDTSKVYASAVHLGDFDEHQKQHHKDDKEHDENSDHQHYTIIVNFITEFTEQFNYTTNLMLTTDIKSKSIAFYQKKYIPNYLNTLFHPPQIA